MKYPLQTSPHSPPSHSHHTHQIRKPNNQTSQQSPIHAASQSRPTPSNQTKASSQDHYEFKIGQQMGEYRITKQLGEGTFGRVLEGEKKGRRYAIKVIRPVGKYIESAKIEREIIKNINKRDEKDEEGIVRYKQSFYHADHFCLVFNPLGLSLYQVIKKNNYRGFPLKMVQSFLKQLFRSIGFLHRLGYTHTDLKPENILLEKEELIEDTSEGYSYYLPKGNKVRVIDFGGATLFNQTHSPIICTRQYRPPEVILECCQWNQFADVWSLGCIAVELLTGELLFPAHGDCEHLVMIAKNSGKVPQWMVNKAASSKLRRLFRDGVVQETEADRQMDSWEGVKGMRTSDEVLGVRNQCRSELGRSELDEASEMGAPEVGMSKVGCQSLRDLVRQCLQIDPNRRINCAMALRHRFFQERVSS